MSAESAIFITGAGSGIGRETAKLFAARGWRVGAFDIDERALDSLKAELGSVGCIAHRLDVRDPAQWAQAVDAFGEFSGGRMDVLFNNAGIGAAGWFEDIPSQIAQEMIQVNLMGAVLGVYACRQLLTDTENAQIVNNGSVLALQGPPFGAVYGATKAALLSLSESLEFELARDGIRVSILLPTQVDTPLMDRPSYTALESSLGDGPAASPAEIAEAVWENTVSARLYLPVGPGSKTMFRLVRWFPSLARWLTRRWLSTVTEGIEHPRALSQDGVSEDER